MKESVRKLSSLLDGSHYFVEPSGPICWADLFGNNNPVELDVGCGKGLFLVRAAQDHPQHNFLGIEVSRKYALYSAARLLRQELSNGRVARADAKKLIQEWIPERSVLNAHVYYPDPWWKRRHKRRRLFSGEFVASIERILLPDGWLCLATDVAEYFEVMEQVMASRPEFSRVEVGEVAQPEHDLDYLTNFERKYRKEGRQVYRSNYRLKARRRQ